jgi:hypothetical protein
MYSTDIVVKQKFIHVDWQSLETEFIIQDQHSHPQTWLSQVKGWKYNRVRNGNTLKHITGWGSKRATNKQRMLEVYTQASKEVMRELMPAILEAKLSILKYYISEIENNDLLSLRDHSHILTKLKTELGEPAIITSSNAQTNPSQPFDAVEKILEAYGIKENGKLIVDDSLKPYSINRVDMQAEVIVKV